MKYVLGAGISGLLYGYYHPDYTVVTDQLGRAVTGADPVVWLNDTKLTRNLLVDLGLNGKPVHKLIGYRYDGRPGALEDWELNDVKSMMDNVFLKKMVPWEALDSALAAGIDVRVKVPSRTLTKENGVLRYLDVSIADVAAKLVDAVRYRIMLGRVTGINESFFKVDEVEAVTPYERVVSTLPAPVFRRLWYGALGLPYLHYCPVTFVVSQEPPAWWDDRFAVVYDADLGSPVSRVGRFGNTWRYEFTGRPDEDTLNDYLPISGGRFVNPYGRIVQDTVLESPDPKITFLGRAAEWDYRGLVDRTLEKVHGQR